MTTKCATRKLTFSDARTFANHQNRSWSIEDNSWRGSILKRKARGNSLNKNINADWLQLVEKDHDKLKVKYCLKLGRNLSQNSDKCIGIADGSPPACGK